MPKGKWKRLVSEIPTMEENQISIGFDEWNSPTKPPIKNMWIDVLMFNKSIFRGHYIASTGNVLGVGIPLKNCKGWRVES